MTRIIATLDHTKKVDRPHKDRVAVRCSYKSKIQKAPNCCYSTFFFTKEHLENIIFRSRDNQTVYYHFEVDDRDMSNVIIGPEIYNEQVTNEVNHAYIEGFVKEVTRQEFAGDSLLTIVDEYGRTIRMFENEAKAWKIDISEVTPEAYFKLIVVPYQWFKYGPSGRRTSKEDCIAFNVVTVQDWISAEYRESRNQEESEEDAPGFKLEDLVDDLGKPLEGLGFDLEDLLEKPDSFDYMDRVLKEEGEPLVADEPAKEETPEPAKEKPVQVKENAQELHTYLPEMPVNNKAREYTTLIQSLISLVPEQDRKSIVEICANNLYNIIKDE